MDTAPRSPTAMVNRGVIAYRAGNTQAARGLFVQALLADPASELGWLWYAVVAETPGHRRYSLDRAIEINSESAGVEARKPLLGETPEIPATLTDLSTAPIPPEIAEMQGRSRFSRPIAPLLNPGRITSHPRIVAVRRNLAVPFTNPTQEEGGRRPKRLVWALVGLVLVLTVAAAFALFGARPERYHVAIVAPLTGD